MADTSKELSTKYATPEGIAQFTEMLQNNEKYPQIDEMEGLRALGLALPHKDDSASPWASANTGILDSIAGRVGYLTEGGKMRNKLWELQQPVSAMIARVNEEKRKSLMGPTHGQVASQGLGPQVGIPMSYTGPTGQQPPQQPSEILTPSVSHPGAMQLGGTTNLPQYAERPNAPLNPLEAMKLHAVGQRLGAAPQQPNEAMFKESTRQRLISGGMDPLVVDKAFASGGFEKEAAPGTDKSRLDKAKADQAQDEADLKHYELAYTPEKLLLANQHSSLQNQKLRDELKRSPENQTIKRQLANSLMTQRSETTKRLNGLAEASKKINMSKEDKLKVDTAIQQWKLWSAFNADTDISKEDMARGEAEILKAAGILTELSQRYPDLVKFMDVGAQHRTLKGVGSPTGARGPATLPPKSQAIYDRIMSQ